MMRFKHVLVGLMMVCAPAACSSGDRTPQPIANNTAAAEPVFYAEAISADGGTHTNSASDGTAKPHTHEEVIPPQVIGKSFYFFQGDVKRACFTNTQNGQPTLCLEMRQKSVTQQPEGESEPIRIPLPDLFQARICKSETAGSFKFVHAWQVTDRSGRFQSNITFEENGGECGQWQDVNVGNLACGLSNIQATVWSPWSCEDPQKCQFSTGALELYKYCSNEEGEPGGAVSMQ